MNKITPIAAAPAPAPPALETTGPLVAVLVYDGLCTFEFAIAAEIFGLPRPEMGLGWYRFAVAALDPGPLRAQGGLTVQVDTGGPGGADGQGGAGAMDVLARADLIVVPGWKGAGVLVPPELCAALVAAHARGARLASICSGAFVLAATGLLDGRRAATHWRYADALARARPALIVDADVLYVEEGRIATSAGSAAGIDLMLHLIRHDFGPRAANSVARRLVVPAHRDGGQAQFVERPVPAHPTSRLGALLDAIRTDPAGEWSVERMAKAAAMSERTLVRRFQQATGSAPGQWLAQTRVALARDLLITTDLPVEEVAARSGFGAPTTLRHHFTRQTGLSPRDYRARFRLTAP